MGYFAAPEESTAAGAAVGAFTSALALVLGSAVAGRPLAGWRPEDAAAAAWTTFLGGILSLATAMVGGAIVVGVSVAPRSTGASRGHHCTKISSTPDGSVTCSTRESPTGSISRTRTAPNSGSRATSVASRCHASTSSTRMTIMKLFAQSAT